jgi:hypothetical protein
MVRDTVWINVYWTITDVYLNLNFRDMIFNNVWEIVGNNVRDNVERHVKLFEYNDLEQYRNNV